MRVAFFELTNERFARTIQIDFAIRLLNEGHEVVWFRNQTPLRLFGEYRITNFLDLKIDLSNTSKILKEVSKMYPSFEVRKFQIQKTSNEAKQGTMTNFASSKAWQETTVLLRDSMPCAVHDMKIAQRYDLLLERLVETFVGFLDSLNFDKVVIYNGRFLREYALWQAADKLHLDTVFLERFNLDWNLKYFEFNEPVHSSIYRAEIINEFYNNSTMNSTEKSKIAIDWFHKRSGGSGTAFTRFQDTEFRPEERFKDIIAFFHSSEDELYSTGLDPIHWKNQFEAIDEIIKLLKDYDDKLLVIRIHPNLLAKSHRELLRWSHYAKSKQSSNVLFILPDSKIQTYDILRQASKIITFGSTIGMEATFLQKPSALLSSALHSHLKALQKIENSEELRHFLVSSPRNLPHIPLGAIMYAFFLEKGGSAISNLTSSSGEIEKQDPGFSYAGIALYKSRTLSVVKRIEGAFLKIFRGISAVKCSLDHNPYIHNQVSG